MAKCDICGISTRGNRRSKIENNLLVCWRCAWAIQKLADGEKYKVVSAYSREFKQRQALETENSSLQIKNQLISKIEKKYQYSNPISAVPPNEILRKALIALDEMKYYHEFSRVLGDYYGIEAPQYYSNSIKVPEGAIACYYPSSNEVYALKERPLSHKTAYHEFWHALERHGIVPNTVDSEKNADLYAKICLKISGESN